jgi:hypothetical protein
VRPVIVHIRAQHRSSGDAGAERPYDRAGRCEEGARERLGKDTGPVHERRGPLHEYESRGNVEARTEGSHGMRHNAKGRTVKAVVVVTRDVS